jgi:hypothetical protein
LIALSISIKNSLRNACASALTQTGCGGICSRKLCRQSRRLSPTSTRQVRPRNLQVAKRVKAEAKRLRRPFRPGEAGSSATGTPRPTNRTEYSLPLSAFTRYVPQTFAVKCQVSGNHEYARSGYRHFSYRLSQGWRARIQFFLGNALSGFWRLSRCRNANKRAFLAPQMS